MAERTKKAIFVIGLIVVGLISIAIDEFVFHVNVY